MTTASSSLNHSPAAIRRAMLLVLAGAVLWSTGGVFIKLLVRDPGWGPFAISTGRSALAAALFFVVLRGRIRIPGGRSGRWFWAGALSYAYVVTAFVLATKMTTAANAIILQDTAPLWVLAFGGVLLGERARWRDGAALAAGLAGVVLCVRNGLMQPRAGGLFSPQTAGDFLALSSGATFGLTTLALRRLSRAAGTAESEDHAALALLCVGNVLAVGAGLAGAFAVGTAFRVPSLAGLAVPLLMLLWLGLVQLGAGYLLVQRGLRRLPAFQASMLMLLEPILNPLWVALMASEIPAGTTMIGGGLVLAGMAIGLTGKRAPSA
jgi:drug/metabolite transporter (DMT)-like permease